MPVIVRLRAGYILRFSIRFIRPDVIFAAMSMKTKLRAVAVAVCVLLGTITAYGQEPEAVAENLADELDAEALDSGNSTFAAEDLMAHLMRLKRHPLNINAASRGELTALELLTPFQIESVLDRISRSGAILSFAELSLLYGFDAQTVERLRPYIVLGPEGRRPRGFAQDQSTDIYARYQRNYAPDAESYLGRIRFSYLDRAEMSLVYKGNSSRSDRSSLCTGSVSYSGLKAGKVELGKLVLGDFYARFAQGLTCWNGFSFAGAAESSGFVKNAEPVSLYTSSDTSKLLRGIAASVSFGGLKFSGGYSFRQDASLARLSYTGKRMRLGFSYTGQRLQSSVFAADFMMGGAGFLIFAEGAVSDGSYAFLGGGSLDAGGAKVHILLRSYQKDFMSDLGGAWSSISKLSNQQGAQLRITVPLIRHLGLAAGADYTAYRYPRYHVNVPSASFKGYVKLSADDSGFGTPARNSLWIKGCFRYDMKASVPAEESSCFSLKAACEVCLASFADLGARAEYNTLGGRAASIFLKLNMLRHRATLSAGVVAYNVPGWDGRIYFPQADVPYTFPVALLYGEGIDAYSYLKTKLRGWLSFYLKYQYNRGRTVLKAALAASF